MRARYFRSAGWSRVVAVVVLLAVVAFTAWNSRPPEQDVPLAARDKPAGKVPKPVATADPRDTARERPDRERTSRPGEKESGKN